MYGTRATGPPTKGAQRRALLADALLRRVALFRHLRQLSLPWRESKGAAPKEAEGELAEEEERELQSQAKQGRHLSQRRWTRTLAKGRGRPLKTKR